MTYSVIYEKVVEPGFEGYYYAHVPSLGITTHGEGIDGARAMAIDAATLLLEDMMAEGKSR